jgi:membrane protein DedA with SNARE-associated domain
VTLGALFGALLAGGIGFPIPEELPLLAAGYLIWRGDVALVSALAVCLLGVALGDALLYALGRHAWVRRLVSPANLARVERQYERHGAKMLVAARFAPGLRSFFLLAAGAGRMPLRRFVPLDFTSALVATVLWPAVGILCAERFQRVVGWVSRTHQLVASGLLVAVAIAYLLVKPCLRRKFDQKFARF